MTTNFEHYITKNIRAFYKRRLGAPLMYFIILLALWFVFPLSDMLTPKEFTDAHTLESAYADGNDYMASSFTKGAI